MTRLGAVQLRIMKVLWDEGEVTARRITDALSETSPIAHSTVQTLLRQLEAKKAVEHRAADRTFLFRALIREDEVAGSVAQDVLSRVFRGSISGLVAYLLDTEEVSTEEIQRLRELVNAKAEEESK